MARTSTRLLDDQARAMMKNEITHPETGPLAIEAAALIEQLRAPNDKTPIERAFVIHIEAFDWNCPQHITPRYTEEEVLRFTEDMRQRIADLQAENKRLRTQPAEPTKP